MPIINEDGQRFVCYLHTNFSTQTQEIKKCLLSGNGGDAKYLSDNQSRFLKSSDGFYLRIAKKYLADSQSYSLVDSNGNTLITA